MEISKPMQVISFRWTAEEKERLEQIARERKVTMSSMFREGLRLYLQDAQEWAEQHGVTPDEREPATG